MNNKKAYESIVQAKKHIQYFLDMDGGFYDVDYSDKYDWDDIYFKIYCLKKYLNDVAKYVCNDSAYIKIAHNVVLATGNFYDCFRAARYNMPPTEYCMSAWDCIAKRMKKKRPVFVTIWEEYRTHDYETEYLRHRYNIGW